MALTSPGVEVTVIDESNYLQGPTNSVPYILIATAQDKVSGSGVGVAAGTLEVNANKLYFCLLLLLFFFLFLYYK